MISLRFSLLLEDISAPISTLLLLVIATNNPIMYLRGSLAYISSTIARNLGLI